SSRLICLMTAGGEIYSRSAALLKLPASATHKNVSSCGLYTQITVLLNHWFYCIVREKALSRLSAQKAKQGCAIRAHPCAWKIRNSAFAGFMGIGEGGAPLCFGGSAKKSSASLSLGY